MDVMTLKTQASELRKAGKFAEALPLYETLWTQHREDCSEWDCWGYAWCLRKTGRSSEALQVCRDAYKDYPDFPKLRSLYGWCIYDLYIKRDDSEIQQDEANFFKAANAIVQLTRNEAYSPYTLTVFKVLDYLKSRPAYPAVRILEWTDKLRPEELSSEPSPFTDKEGKSREYASDREKWYSYRTKALFKLGRYEECIQVAEEALASITKFHHDNDIWFRSRIALSRAKLGDPESAIAEMESLLARKKDWFIHREIAQLLLGMGRTDEALNRGIEALLAPGPSDLGFKWELFLLMGRIFQEKGDLERARKHILLAVKVRQAEDWRIPQELSEAVAELGVDMADQVSAEDLHRELRQEWKAMKLSQMPHAQGVITNLVGEGKAGFIRGDNGQDYYFKVQSFRGPRDRLAPGLRVQFYVEKSADPSKRDNAVFIEEIGD